MAATTGATSSAPSQSATVAAESTESIADIFASMSYGPAPEADNVVQVKLTATLNLK